MIGKVRGSVRRWRERAAPRFALGALAAGLLSSLAPPLPATAAASAVAPPTADTVRIVRPVAGEPAFGPTPVAVSVRGGRVRQIELLLDGRRVGRILHPPWSTEVDLGQENVARRLRAIATFESGAVASSEIVLSPIRVDEEIELPLRQIYVTASRDGDPVLDLERRDFRLVDDGRAEPLVTFERGDIPLTAVLVIDASISMRGAPLAGALAGARAFAAAMAELDEAMLLAVSDRVLARSAFTRDPEALVAGTDAAAARGGTALYDHLFLALVELGERQGRKVIVLLSDGVDVDSLLSTSDLEPLLDRSSALLYWIRLGAPKAEVRHRSAWRDFDEHDAELRSLARLVDESGGRTIPLANADEAPAVFAALLAELRGQYALGYYPTSLRGDGRFRRVRVQVSRSGVRLRARDGYFDD